MGIGYLEVIVNTASKALPVAGASVVIKNSDGVILMQLITDESGLTETVQLECPNKEHTLNPNDPGPHYGKYDVEITAEGYNPTIIHDVHIFDTETSFLPENMLPLLDSETRTHDVKIEETYIPEHAIELRTTKQQQGGVSPRVMGEVFIPYYMTVHLGSPK